MTCSDLEPWMQAYVDGEFSPEDALEVEQHLVTCPSCEERMRSEARSRAALRLHLKASQTSAPPSVRAAVHSGLVKERRRAVTAQLSRWGSVTLAMAAATTAAWGLRPRPEDPLKTAAALRHAKRLPLEVRDPALVEAWFDGKLSHPVRLPRLSNATLAGARLSHVSDREAAYVSYETSPVNGGPAHRVGLFVLERSRATEPSATLEVSPAHGYNVATWHGDGVTYELVTDLDEGEIRRMVGVGAPGPYAVQPASLTGH